MTSEELAAQRVRDRATYQRMRERMVLDPECREARLAVSRRGTKKWRAMNRDNPTVIEKRRAKDRARWAAFNDELNARKRRAYVGEQAERIRAKNRDWYSRNVERRRAYNKAYRLATRNLLSERERNRRRYAQDPRRWNEYQKAWRAKNSTRARLYVRISANKRRGAPGEFSAEQWQALVRVYDFRCGYCGRVKPLHADHRTPISRGGPNTIDNIIPACKRCNSRKHNKTEAEFRAWLTRVDATDSSPARVLLPVLVGSAPAG